MPTPRASCDTHVHLFGPSSVYRFVAGRTYTPGDAQERQLLALHDRLGFDRVVIIQPSVYGSDNRRTLAGLKKLGARARAIAVIGPATTDAELVSMHEAGVRGVRVNLATHALNDPDHAWREITGCASRVAPMGWHVQALTNLSVIGQLKERIPDLPAPLVIDHFGLIDPAAGVEQPGFADLVDLVSKGQVIVKLSAVERLTGMGKVDAIIPFVEMLARANSEQLVWGSDWPHTGAGPRHARPISEIEPFESIDDARSVDVVINALGDAKSVEQVFVHTPAKLYDFLQAP